MPTSPKPYCVHPQCASPRASGAYCRQHAAQYERQRPNKAIRRQYSQRRWEGLRQQQRWANPLCVECQAEGRLTLWDDLDHIVPHRIAPERFFDPSNVQGLCKRHHSVKTKRGQ